MVDGLAHISEVDVGGASASELRMMLDELIVSAGS
jgi:hypothetical protein